MLNYNGRSNNYKIILSTPFGRKIYPEDYIIKFHFSKNKKFL